MSVNMYGWTSNVYQNKNVYDDVVRAQAGARAFADLYAGSKVDMFRVMHPKQQNRVYEVLYSRGLTRLMATANTKMQEKWGVEAMSNFLPLRKEVTFF